MSDYPTAATVEVTVTAPGGEQGKGSATISLSWPTPPPPVVAGRLGAYCGGGNALPSAGFETAIMGGRKVATFSLYEWVSNDSFPPPAVVAEVAAGRRLSLCLASRLSSGLGIPWSVISRGQYDQELEGLSGRLAALSGPVYVGYDNEFDGADRQAQSGQITDYPAAFAHVMGILKSGAPNVVRCWVPTGNHATSAVADAYPGDDHVDEIMWDPYDPTFAKGSFEATVEPFANWLTSQSFGKSIPWGLFETGCPGADPRAAAWISGIPAGAKMYELESVRWFNSSDRWDTVIPPGSPAASAFAHIATDPYFATPAA